VLLQAAYVVLVAGCLAVALVAVLVAAGGAPQPVVAGLPDPGPVVGWGAAAQGG
jgi:hypothetical protein